MALNKIVSKDEWDAARRSLLSKEKEFTRLRDELSAEQRGLPWTRVDRNYVFEGLAGKVTLSDLFQNRSQLFLKHFMMGPGAVADRGRLRTSPICTFICGIVLRMIR
jgi:predicted dithiol-disulfide oxidoreductase (DUF899 family)